MQAVPVTGLAGTVQGELWLLVLPLDLSAVAQARAFVLAACRAVGFADDAGEVAVLLTSETVTNAFIHGRSSARLSVRVNGRCVRVEVSDDNSRHPQPVDKMTRRWTDAA